MIRALSTHEQDVVKLLCQIINRRQIITFYYESKNGNKGWRKVEPYLVALDDKGAGPSFLCALPVEELDKEIGIRYTGHYFLEKIDLDKFKILQETYVEPNVARDRITSTPTIEVICRYIYADE
jgi:hypothetical protein